MFWNDPNLYSVAFKDVNPVQTPFLGAFPPIQSWQTAPRFVPTPFSMHPGLYNTPFMPYNPYLQTQAFHPINPYTVAPYNIAPYNVTPYPVNPYAFNPYAMTPLPPTLPQQFPYRPFGI